MIRLRIAAIFSTSLFLATGPACSADMLGEHPLRQAPSATRPLATKVSGRVSVIDGRSLWFPQHGIRVKLAGIDTCELPQWGFDPKAQSGASGNLKPVPCGAFAKAWLKRVIQNRPVVCRMEPAWGIIKGQCLAGDRDLSLELLRVGLARVAPKAFPPDVYAAAEVTARAARYGFWGAYILDMDEWRMRAVDRTEDRRPIADYNLLRGRHSEVSPPFEDAKHLPSRTDR